MKILFATGNKNKLREFSGLTSGLGVAVVSLGDYPGLELPPEDGDTFTENALAKARFASGFSGLPAVADDSGLVVDALGGRPGVYSARYAGPGATDRDNIDKLLNEMRGIDDKKRTARFVCALAYVEPGGVEKTFSGTLEGVITLEPSGEGGFGYDPVFFIPEKGVTAAGLSMEDKNAISHRGKALRQFREWFVLSDAYKEGIIPTKRLKTLTHGVPAGLRNE